MNERIYLFHITATWQEQKQTYSRDFLVCAEDKDTAEKIAKNHVPLQTIGTPDHPENLTFRVRNLGTPQNRRTYFSSMIYTVNGMEKNPHTVQQHLIMAFAILWGKQFQAKTAKKRLLLMNRTDHLYELFTAWANEYTTTSNTSIGSFFKEKLSALTNTNDPIVENTDAPAVIPDKTDAIIEDAKRQADEIIKAAREQASQIMDTIRPLMEFCSNENLGKIQQSLQGTPASTTDATPVPEPEPKPEKDAVPVEPSPVETTDEPASESDEIEPNVDAISNTNNTNDNETTADTTKPSEEPDAPDTNVPETTTPESETPKQEDESEAETETPPEESVPENIETETPSEEAPSDANSEQTASETESVPEKNQEELPTDHTEQPDEYDVSDISDEELLDFAKQTFVMVNDIPSNGLLAFQSIIKKNPGSKQKHRNTLLNLMKNDMRMPLTNENAWECFKKLHQKGTAANE